MSVPWGYAADAGIGDQWARKYDIEIKVVQNSDCVESIDRQPGADLRQGPDRPARASCLRRHDHV
jgi:hypothetical protein